MKKSINDGVTVTIWTEERKLKIKQHKTSKETFPGVVKAVKVKIKLRLLIPDYYQAKI